MPKGLFWSILTFTRTLHLPHAEHNTYHNDKIPKLEKRITHIQQIHHSFHATHILQTHTYCKFNKHPKFHGGGEQTSVSPQVHLFFFISNSILKNRAGKVAYFPLFRNTKCLKVAYFLAKNRAGRPKKKLLIKKRVYLDKFVFKVKFFMNSPNFFCVASFTHGGIF